MACVAYEKFDADEPRRVWRDAPHDPSPVIGRRILVASKGKEWVEQHFPVQKMKLTRGEAMLSIIAAADDPSELRRLARRMRDDGYSPIDVAVLMSVSVIEARLLMDLAPE